MGHFEIRDHAVWAKHIEGAPHIVEKINSLKENSALSLIIDGKPVLFRKMRNGSDGRPTAGIRPDDSFKEYWKEIYQTRRGENVSIDFNDNNISDTYLASVSALMSEWDSDEDNEAFNDL